MALTYKTIERPAKTERYADKIICELCKEEGRWHQHQVGQFIETKIVLTEGYRYPESTCYTEYHLDICPECFQTKLAKWFKEQGGNVREEEIDF